MIDLKTVVEAEITRRLAGTRRRELFIWGAGEAGRRAIRILRAGGVHVTGFVDSSTSKQGTVLEGVPVLSPQVLYGRRPSPRILVASMFHREIVEQIRGMGFRSGRDYIVVPAQSELLPLSAGGADMFAVWRARWRTRLGISGATPKAHPAVKMLRMPQVAPWRVARQLLNRRLPVSDSAWVCLHDPRVLGASFRWRRGRVPGPEHDFGQAVYDPESPLVRASSRPFLLRSLLDSASLCQPVVCRSKAIRQFLREEAGTHFSMQRLVGWAADRGAMPTTEFSGVCSYRGVRAAANRGAPVRARQVAPSLVGFARDLARTGSLVFSPEEISSLAERLTPPGIQPHAGWEYITLRRSKADAVVRLQVLVHSEGNFFFREIRDVLAANWRRAGALVSLGDQTSKPAGQGWHKLVVAPHEFFLLPGRHPGWERASDVCTLNTEQPQTRWFASCLSCLLASPLVFDINWQSTLMLRTLGIDAHFLPLGWDPESRILKPRRRVPAHPRFSGLVGSDRSLPGRSDWMERPIDILFVGTLSERRTGLLAHAAMALAQHRCFMHLPPSDRPLLAGEADSLSGRDMADLCRRAKIVLNIHRDRMPYCEWHRIAFQAIQHGALVASEPMMRVPGFEPGRDFVALETTALLEEVDWLLRTPDGRKQAAAMALRATLRLRRRFSARRIALRSLELFRR